MTDEPDLVHGTNYRLVLNGDSWRRRVMEDPRFSPHVIARWNILNGTFYIPQPRAEPITVRYSLRDDPNWGYTISKEVEEPIRKEPTWQPPNWIKRNDAEWAAQTVDTLAQVGIPTEDIPNALRLVARLQERGIDNAAEVAGIAHVWLVASRG